MHKFFYIGLFYYIHTFPLQAQSYQKLSSIKSCESTIFRNSLNKNLIVYKILTHSEWSGFKKNRVFYGSPHDIRDGFIHLSKKKQLNRVLKKYFSTTSVYITNHKIIEFGKYLRWEDEYPHLFEIPLLMKTVNGVCFMNPPYK